MSVAGAAARAAASYLQLDHREGLCALVQGSVERRMRRRAAIAVFAVVDAAQIQLSVHVVGRTAIPAI